jgi:hypothetical protein
LITLPSLPFKTSQRGVDVTGNPLASKTLEIVDSKVFSKDSEVELAAGETKKMELIIYPVTKRFQIRRSGARLERYAHGSAPVLRASCSAFFWGLGLGREK